MGNSRKNKILNILCYVICALCYLANIVVCIIKGPSLSSCLIGWSLCLFLLFLHFLQKKIIDKRDEHIGKLLKAQGQLLENLIQRSNEDEKDNN